MLSPQCFRSNVHLLLNSPADGLRYKVHFPAQGSLLLQPQKPQPNRISIQPRSAIHRRAHGEHVSTIIPRTAVQLEDGSIRHQSIIDQSPFTIGRLQDRHLVLTHPYVSRDHAQIVYEDGSFHLVDMGSRHGTYIRGQRVDGRQQLNQGDTIRLGSQQGPLLRFGVEIEEEQASIKELIGQMSGSSAPNSDLEKLRWFLEAARKLNQVGAVDEILASLVETTLQLTKVERGYVFLKGSAGELKLAVGRSITGEVLTDDLTISRSALLQATRTAAEYIVTDTLTAEADSRSESMVAQSIRTVICMPLRGRYSENRPSLDSSPGPSAPPPAARGEIIGALYLDSRLTAGKLTQVDSDLLQTIATEAAALVENANLALAEDAARRYREELSIAATIQQGLMTVKIPETRYANVTARNIPCKEIGGDFFDVIADEDGLSVVVVDVSGKGVSAALLASTLQGLIYSQMLARQPLEQIARLVNRYICAKDVDKYATMVALKLSRSGNLQYINCGHVMPLLVTTSGSGESHMEKLTTSNMPVGLLEDAAYEAGYLKMPKGSRLILVTDGVTEAENHDGEFYGDDRLEAAVCQHETLEGLFASVQTFADGAPPNDDCTMVEVKYVQPA